MRFKHSLEKAQGFSDIFRMVKKIVKDYLGKDQAGLLVGLSDLGHYGHSFLGAFYSMDANTIIINKRPLDNLQQTNPQLHTPYLFHVLLHEYLHSLGLFDEAEVRMLSYDISKSHFGENHIATQMALNMERFIPELTMSSDFEAPENMQIEFIQGIDRDNTNYIM